MSECKTTVCIGGQESGRLVPDTGKPEYRFQKQSAAPLSVIEHDGATIRFYEVRYIKTEVQWQGKRHTVYVWEHDIHRDLIELLTSELSRVSMEKNT